MPKIKLPNKTKSVTENKWYLYVLRTARGALYCGITNDLERRFKEHQNMGAKTAKALRGKGPLEMVFNCVVGDRSNASKLEYKFKSHTKVIKETLIKLPRKDFIAAVQAESSKG